MLGGEEAGEPKSRSLARSRAPVVIENDYCRTVSMLFSCATSELVLFALGNREGFRQRLPPKIIYER